MSLLLFIGGLWSVRQHQSLQQELEAGAGWGLEGEENGCPIWRPVHLEMFGEQTTGVELSAGQGTQGF